MTRPRVLCVSGDRSTRAAVTLSLTDAPVNVVIAQQSSAAIDRLERESIDAVVIDASTVADVPGLVDAVDSETPGTPTFVHWGEGGDGSVAVLSEVVARADDDSSDRLAAAIRERIDVTDADWKPGTERVSGPNASSPLADAESPGDGDAAAIGGAEPSSRELPGDLADIVASVRRRLVDVTSPLAIERTLREEFTASDRFTFAWVGEYDRGEREIVPWLPDPVAIEWPIQRTISIGHGTQPLIERAMHARGLQVAQDVSADWDDVPFGDYALEQGARAAAVAPLASVDEVYGVFVVYADTPFSGSEQTTVRSVAETASHVLESIAARGRLEQRERALHRYERLVETAGDGMYVFDAQGHFMTVNDALVEMTGYSREGLLGEHASILFDEDDIGAGEALIKSLLTGDSETATLELTLGTKDDGTFPCEVQIAVLVPDGDFAGSVGVIRDVTERKRSERKLRERNERLDAFARIVSHDLRNPLGVAQGYLDLLEETGDLEYTQNVDDGLDRMEAIIEDVLAIAREGEWAAETESVDLEATAAEAWDHVSTDEATLSIAAPTSLEADRSRFLRLLENLFRNAVEHGTAGHNAADGGVPLTVRVGPLESDDREGFFVEDDGRGLPDKLRDRIFDPAVSSSSEGLGIGLWIVREIATGHGWTVVAAESAAGGARFEFETDGQFSD